jgi:hypothetical protein
MGIEMPRTAAKVTQADIARVLRAIESVGAKVRVEVLPDGTIRMDPVDSAEVAKVDRRVPVDL